MAMLVWGLVLFLGVHSVRIFADRWRTTIIERRGEGTWKGLYSVVSLAGLVLMAWGYGAARQQPVVLWMPPRGMNHVAALLTLLAFVLLAATYVPRNQIKALIHHPMVLGVKIWAFAHLISNGTLADVVLFGSFLLWAALSFSSARRRDRAQGTVYASGTSVGTLLALVAGGAAWAVFALWAHGWLIGVRPLG